MLAPRRAWHVAVAPPTLNRRLRRARHPPTVLFLSTSDAVPRVDCTTVVTAVLLVARMTGSASAATGDSGDPCCPLHSRARLCLLGTACPATVLPKKRGDPSSLLLWLLLWPNGDAVVTYMAPHAPPCSGRLITALELRRF